ncbi:MAG: hypothetical protein ACOX5W_03960 [Bacillota bacterium]
MSVKMVDMQVLIPKVQEVAKTQQIQQQGLPNQQASLAAQLRQEAAHKQSSVQETPQSEESKILDQEKERKNRDEPRNRKKKDEKQRLASSSKDPRLGNKVDIII